MGQSLSSVVQFLSGGSTHSEKTSSNMEATGGQSSGSGVNCKEVESCFSTDVPKDVQSDSAECPLAKSVAVCSGRKRSHRECVREGECTEACIEHATTQANAADEPVFHDSSEKSCQSDPHPASVSSLDTPACAGVATLHWQHSQSAQGVQPDIASSKYVKLQVDEVPTGPLVQLSNKADSQCVASASRQPVPNTSQEESDLAESSSVYAPISELPAHLLLAVFHYLPLYDLLRASRVCKDWHQLSHDSHLWRTINLHGQLKVDDQVLARVTTYSNNVGLLDITESRLVTQWGLTKALENCPSLHNLQLVRCHHLNEEGLKSIGRLCHHLVTLNLDCCYAVSDAALMSIAEGCPKLRDVRLNQCCVVTSKGVSAIAKGCPELRCLSLDQCTKVDGSCLSALAENCPHLHTLTAMTCNFTDVDVQAIAQLKELYTLELPNIQALTTVGVGRLVRACHSITSLNLSLCRAIDDHCVQLIGQHLPGLLSLHLISCSITDAALTTLSQHCKQLSTLDVAWCKNISDKGVQQIVDNARHLTYLGLMRCDQVTMGFSEELVLRYPQITFSTMWLDCRRLLERVQREGLAVGANLTVNAQS